MWKPVQRRRIAEEVARQLRSTILQGKYQPGDKLPPERKLAESLGVNRATLREALHALEQTGLVLIRQGDGTRVLDFIETASLDLLSHLIPLSAATRQKVLKDILEFRQLAGREMARLAARRASPGQITRLAEIANRPAGNPEESLSEDLDFYFQLARSTNNMVFPLLFNPVRAAVQRFSRFFAKFNPPPEEVKAHQRELVAALEAQDPQAAYEAAARHLRRGMERLEKR